jgi:hypothetical protein
MYAAFARTPPPPRAVAVGKIKLVLKSKGVGTVKPQVVDHG